MKLIIYYIVLILKYTREFDYKFGRTVTWDLKFPFNYSSDIEADRCKCPYIELTSLKILVT